MTRENKLALVVGFGLILLVGVLISDHFSIARSQDPADLSVNRPMDPLSERRRSDPTLINLQARRESTAEPEAGDGFRQPPLAMNTMQFPQQDATNAAARDDARASQVGNGVQRVIMGETAPVTRTNEEPRNGQATRSNGESFVFHDVKPGETLIAICRRYYGDATLVNELATFNGLADANSLRADHRLRIPDASALAGGDRPAHSAQPRQSQAQETVYTTYTVQRNDTLSELSLKLLGTSRRWRELYELNRSEIDDPNNLLVGTVLKVPRPG